MKLAQVAFSLMLVSAPAVVNAMEENPLAKVLQMIDDLSAKIVAEGEAEDKAYHEFVEWCDDKSGNTANEIKTAETKKAKLEASIAELQADITDSTTKIEELVASHAKSSSELNDATAIRDKEHADFAAEEAELEDGLDTLGRAIGLLEKEMAKNPAALAQIDTSNLNAVIKAIGAVMDAAAFPLADKKKLVSMVQSHQEGDAADEQDPGAPAPTTYKTHSTGIVEVLEDMKEKAEEELDALRKAETTEQNNFEMLKQSLEDSMAADSKDMDDEKAAAAKAEEDKATAEGDLTATVKTLAQAEQDKDTVANSCMATATDHEASTKNRAEELSVIAQAKKILVESTEGAAKESYSLLQFSAEDRQGLRLQTRWDLANREVITVVQKLAQEHNSAELAQLASRIATVVKFGAASGDDPFAKVKGLIETLIAKLQKEAEEGANEHAYCKEQMAKTEAKKVDLEDTISSLTTKLDKASSASTTLKAEVKDLQAELAKLLEEQTEMDKIRAEEHAAYLQAKDVLEKGLGGVRKALEVLRNYYGGAAAALVQQPKVPVYHSAASGAGGGIISFLEVIESDFAKSLAGEETQESDAADEYDKVTQENKVDTTNKQGDVKYKTQEYTRLDKAIADLTSDRETTQSELDAVMEYYAKIKDRCIAKPETYEEIKKRRDAEIAGLKQALSILEGEAAFMQGKKRGLRGGYLGL